MLVDIRSSAYILYLSTYDKLGLPRNILQPMHTPLTGFTGHSVYPKGMTTLDFAVGSGNKKSIIRAQFTVVDIPDSPYNGLIGRPILNALRAVISPVHLKMKFPTTGGIGEICGNQKKARICYLTSVPPLGKNPERSKKSGRENYPEVMSTRGEIQKDDDNSPKERENLKRPVPHGARNEKGSGAGILIRGPDDKILEYTLRFTFPITNNEVEYEALVAGFP
ncbi:hypothetical protein LIER_40904 [Lithospermum erythrorhizon]|uniref:Reverse transcriptase domain-containing protein n=1 Tax=Lithospermum erythrorhizon TaxID=34254 RepID=A0AAV3R5I3_LITER